MKRDHRRCASAWLLLAAGLQACGGAPVDARRAAAHGAVLDAERQRRSGHPIEAAAALAAARSACGGDPRCEGIVAIGLGEHHAATGAPIDAKAECETARDVAAAASDARHEARALSCIAAAALAHGTFAECDQAAAAATTVARREGDRAVAAWAGARRGAALWRMGRSSEAEQVLTEAATDAEGAPLVAAEVSRQRAVVAAGLGKRAAARATLEALVLQFRSLGDVAGEAAALSNLAGVHANLGDKQKALALGEQSLVLRRTVGDRQGEAVTISDIGLVHSDLGEPLVAIERHREALVLRRAISDRAGEASSLNNLGIAYSNQGDKQQALEVYQQALAAFRDTGDRNGESGTLNNLGSLYANLGDPRRSLDYFTQVLAIVHAASDRPSEATTLGNIGLVQSSLGEKEKALASYQQSLPLFRAVGDRGGEARTLNNIGLLYSELGDRQRAVDYYLQALPVRQAVGDRAGVAGTLNNLAILYSAIGDQRRALAVYEQAAAVFRAASDRAGEATTLNNIGLVHLNAGEPKLALALDERALAIFRAIGDRTGEARVLTNAGIAEAALGDTKKALARYTLALPIRRAVADRAGEALTLTKLAALLAPTSPARAIFHAKQAVNLYQSLRADVRGLDPEVQRGYARTVGSAYRLLADLLAAAGRLDEAQGVLGLLKDEEFFEFVRRDAQAVAGDPVALRAGEDAAARRYNELAGPITTLAAEWSELSRKPARTASEEARVVALDRQIEDANARFVAFLDGLGTELTPKAGAAPALDDVTSGIANVLDKLDPGTVAVFTLSGESNLRSILVTTQVRKGYSAKVPIGAAELGKKTLALRQALEDPRKDPRPLAEEIYDALVRPMEADLVGARARTILWFLDGPLRYVPMAALYDGRRWLAQSYRSVVIAGESLTELQSMPRASWSALALGVTAGHEGFSPLPGVAAEVTSLVGDGGAVRGILPGTGLLDAAFTEATLLDAVRRHPAVIHVASHFAFKPGDEARSFLLLGDGKHLTLGELRLKPRIFAGVDLLVLSACQTAVQGGEGSEVDGLARIAQKKGAAAVLATLWPVSDASTPTLMRRFYELREARKLSKAEALQAAQLELASGAITHDATASQARGVHTSEHGAGPAALPGWTHPYYWAPFILLGNGR